MHHLDQQLHHQVLEAGVACALLPYLPRAYQRTNEHHSSWGLLQWG